MNFMKLDLNSSHSILPKDGSAYLFPRFFNVEESAIFFDQLKNNINWRQKKIQIFGKQIPEPRLTNWQGDKGLAYKYSGQTMEAEPWDVGVQKILKKINQQVGLVFNSCLLNYYRDGQDSMGWHRDNEPELGANPAIASVSFGQTRVFKFRHKQNKDLKLNIPLEDGSLLLMLGETQNHWEHSVAKTKRKIGPRMNLTYRLIKQK